MTAQQLAEQCRELGAPIHRSTITKIENGRTRFDLGELLVLAAALFIPPVALVFPGPYNDEIDVLPELKATQFDAAQWFSGLENFAFGAQSSDLNAARALVIAAARSAKGRELVESALEKLDALEMRLDQAEARDKEQTRIIEALNRQVHGIDPGA